MPQDTDKTPEVNQSNSRPQSFGSAFHSGPHAQANKKESFIDRWAKQKQEGALKLLEENLKNGNIVIEELILENNGPQNPDYTTVEVRSSLHMHFPRLGEAIEENARLRAENSKLKSYIADLRLRLAREAEMIERQLMGAFMKKESPNGEAKCQNNI